MVKDTFVIIMNGRFITEIGFLFLRREFLVCLTPHPDFLSPFTIHSLMPKCLSQ